MLFTLSNDEMMGGINRTVELLRKEHDFFELVCHGNFSTDLRAVVMTLEGLVGGDTTAVSLLSPNQLMIANRLFDAGLLPETGPFTPTMMGIRVFIRETWGDDEDDCDDY